MAKLSCPVAIFCFFAFFQSVNPVFADSSDQFITIVNPVRISSYSPDPVSSLISEYSEVSKRGLAATWLVTYDALNSSVIRTVLSKMDSDQEIGLFMEVSPKYSEDSGVIYNKTDSWFRANSLFLSGYDQKDRLKLIDAIFKAFKTNFGYYPKSVGAWWIDSYSLDYMQQKYGVSAALVVADQFSTDGYRIWGTYFGIPFYPSKMHSGIPAQSQDNKIDVVAIQWAPRDPLNGYGPGVESKYSVQDYLTMNLKEDYFRRLINLYAFKNSNSFGQMTFGLESDLPAEGYKKYYADQLDVIKSFLPDKKLSVVTMYDFSKFYRDKFSDISPPQLISTRDFLGTEREVFWYQSPFYRVGIVYDEKSNQSKIFDLRVYTSNFAEPYYTWPNKSLNLNINIPSIVDNTDNPKEGWILENKPIQSINSDPNNFSLIFNNGGRIIFKARGFELVNVDSRRFTGYQPLISTSVGRDRTVVTFGNNWINSKDGLVYRALTAEAFNFLMKKKVLAALSISIFILLVSLLVLNRLVKDKKRVRFFACLVVFLISISSLFIYWKSSQQYSISQAESDSLFRLLHMPYGKVLVYDQVCLQCRWYSSSMPAVFANKRGYVGELSHKPIVYNRSIFKSLTREGAKKELLALGVKYIYLVKYGDYEEKTPFSPGDLNIEKIYDNANSEIWEVGSI